MGFTRTGDARSDRANRALARGQRTDRVEVTVSGVTGRAIQRVTHRLGREAQGWRVVQAFPAVAGVSPVVDAAGGRWDKNAIELEFPGAGTWVIEVF